MSADDETPFGDPLGPLGAIFGQMSSMMGSGNQWDAAAQMAAGIANEGRSEANLDPADRIALEGLARVGELQVAGHTNLDFREPIRVEAMNRTQWSKRFLNDQRPLIEGIAGSLGEGLAAQLNQLGDLDSSEMPEIPGIGPMPPEMIRQVMSMMESDDAVDDGRLHRGHLAARRSVTTSTAAVRGRTLPWCCPTWTSSPRNWSLPEEDIRLWVCATDAAHHLDISIPHVRDALTGAIGREMDPCILGGSRGDRAPRASSVWTGGLRGHGATALSSCATTRTACSG